MVGWVTALAYLVVGILALRHAWGLGRAEASRRLLGFWWVTGVLLLLLAVNKQLDLQSLLYGCGTGVVAAAGVVRQPADVFRGGLLRRWG